jgi:hypothetical protein
MQTSDEWMQCVALTETGGAVAVAGVRVLGHRASARNQGRSPSPPHLFDYFYHPHVLLLLEVMERRPGECKLTLQPEE